MLSFLKEKKQKINLGSHTRVVLIVGGAGILGQALCAQRPENTFIINISRTRSVVSESVYNHHADILENPEKTMASLAQLVDSVDVVINAAYSREFSSVQNISRNTFLKEMELNVYIPMVISMHCARLFWRKNTQQENTAHARKVINISSGAAFGKTARPELATYSGTKAALNVMTEYLHDELYTSYGVSAHIIAPGALSNRNILQNTVHAIWDLAEAQSEKFTMQKIF